MRVSILQLHSSNISPVSVYLCVCVCVRVCVRVCVCVFKGRIRPLFMEPLPFSSLIRAENQTHALTTLTAG